MYDASADSLPKRTESPLTPSRKGVAARIASACSRPLHVHVAPLAPAPDGAWADPGTDSPAIDPGATERAAAVSAPTTSRSSAKMARKRSQPPRAGRQRAGRHVPVPRRAWGRPSGGGVHESRSAAVFATPLLAPSIRAAPTSGARWPRRRRGAQHLDVVVWRWCTARCSGPKWRGSARLAGCAARCGFSSRPIVARRGVEQRGGEGVHLPSLGWATSVSGCKLVHCNTAR